MSVEKELTQDELMAKMKDHAVDGEDVPGDLLRQWRRASVPVTPLERLAEAIGVDTSSVSRWERSKVPLRIVWAIVGLHALAEDE